MIATRDSVPSSRADTQAVETAGDVSRHEMDRARARVYLLLANLFARAPSAALLRDIADLRGDASPLGMALLRLAAEARMADRDALSDEHFRLFFGVARGEVVPYASYYLTGFLNERPLARVRRDMSDLGIERRSGVFEPEDHIASLFEVMAGLIGGELDRPAVDADHFFSRHIAPWAPRFLADVAVAPAAQFYRHVAALGQVWLEVERQSLQLPPEPLRA